MTLARLFSFKKKSLEQSYPIKVSSDHVQIRLWYKFVEDEEGSACVALTMDRETRLILCNYEGNIKQIIRRESHDEKLRLVIRELGEYEFSRQYVTYKAAIKDNINFLFEPVSAYEDKLRMEYAAYNADVKTLIWNIFTPIISYEAQNIGWGYLQKCLEIKHNFDIPAEPQQQLAHGRGRGHTV